MCACLCLFDHAALLVFLRRLRFVNTMNKNYFRPHNVASVCYVQIYKMQTYQKCVVQPSDPFARKPKLGKKKPAAKKPKGKAGKCLSEINRIEADRINRRDRARQVIYSNTCTYSVHNAYLCMEYPKLTRLPGR